jgi:hypothetical protein
MRGIEEARLRHWCGLPDDRIEATKGRLGSFVRMPRFYFDAYDGDRFIADADGLILDDVEEAKHEAVQALPDMA